MSGIAKRYEELETNLKVRLRKARSLEEREELHRRIRAVYDNRSNELKLAARIRWGGGRNFVDWGDGMGSEEYVDSCKV
jgi:hypothetical protein